MKSRMRERRSRHRPTKVGNERSEWQIRKSGSVRGGEVPKLEFQRLRLPIAGRLAAQGNRKRKRKNHKRLLDSKCQIDACVRLA
jgi:hypothetical protein